MGVSLGVFMLALAAISFTARVLTGKDITWNKGDTWVVLAYAAWGFAYFAYSWATSGRTAGMALFGVRVVREDGTDASGRRAVVRTLALPLSFLFWGWGSSASCWAAGAGHCMTSSPGRRSSTPGTRGRRGCGSCPGTDPAQHLSRGGGHGPAWPAGVPVPVPVRWFPPSRGCLCLGSACV